MGDLGAERGAIDAGTLALGTGANVAVSGSPGAIEGYLGAQAGVDATSRGELRMDAGRHADGQR